MELRFNFCKNLKVSEEKCDLAFVKYGIDNKEKQKKHYIKEHKEG